MTAANAMKRLQRLDFPECTREALQYIVSVYRSQDGPPIPGLSGGPEAVVGEICQAFVLFRTKRGIKVLNALQELQLLELLCECFKGAAEKYKYRIFQLLFGNRGDDVASTLLTKVVSMALSMSCSSVLDCTAIWMQERGCKGSESLLLTKRLVEDYCQLFPDPSNIFHRLPSISPLFVCNLTTAVTALFPFTSAESVPPPSLLEHVTFWVTADCTLCCESIRQVAIHGTCSSPIPGLLAWCVVGPLICTRLLRRQTSAASAVDKGLSVGSKLCRASLPQSLNILSKLHLGVLQSVDFCSNIALSQCLLSVTDATCIAEQLSVMLRDRVGGLEEEAAVVHLALERLAQVLQVAKMAGCLSVQRGSMSDLASILSEHLPQNRLLNMVISGPSSRHTVMDTS